MYIHTKYSTSHHNHNHIQFESRIQLGRSVISRNEELGIYVYVFKRSDQTSPLFFFVRRIHSLGCFLSLSPLHLSCQCPYYIKQIAKPHPLRLKDQQSTFSFFIKSIQALTHSLTWTIQKSYLWAGAKLLSLREHQRLVNPNHLHYYCACGRTFLLSFFLCFYYHTAKINERKNLRSRLREDG